MRCSGLVLIVALSAAVSAQTPTFDVASVKPEVLDSGATTYNAILGRIVHGQLTMANVTFSEALRFAYGINNDAQIAGPDWIKSRMVRFKIDAKAAPETSREQIQLMLRGLLNERFQLKTHIEQREIAHLELVRGAKALKLQPAQDGSDGSGNRNADPFCENGRNSDEAESHRQWSKCPTGLGTAYQKNSKR
jgi:uncharacterized protein (TIGR03435 family)